MGKLEIVGERKHHGVRCFVLRLGQEDWTDEIWVDATRYLVLKSVFRKKTLFGTITTTTTWRNFQLQPPDPALFRFKPPPGATETNALKIP